MGKHSVRKRVRERKRRFRAYINQRNQTANHHARASQRGAISDEKRDEQVFINSLNNWQRQRYMRVPKKDRPKTMRMMMESRKYFSLIPLTGRLYPLERVA